ncbi:MAG: Gfo/Idh/MocA family oxidoreductase [Elusimicrobia bacterium]|nr:Gfo/Idh/MocA family oxidoreductase [Elusimicrobiota bacterium]
MENHQDMKRVLLIGCGQLGSRHLQAAASLPGIDEIELVDPRQPAIDQALSHLKELPSPIKAKVKSFTSLDQATPGGDLCIVATLADHRPQAIRQAADDLGYRSFLAEKLLAQSVSEYEALLVYSRARQLSIWVDLNYRAYEFYRKLKQTLAGEPFIFTATAGAQGLANNGIHSADLFLFLDGSDDIGPVGSFVYPGLLSSKRGSHIFDLSGTLHGATPRGSQFILSYFKEGNASEHVNIVSSRYRAIVDPTLAWAYESDSASGWQWRSVPFAENIFISHMSRGFVTDILQRGQCYLPTIEQAWPSHRFILGELTPHFQKLLKVEAEKCPVV